MGTPTKVLKTQFEGTGDMKGWCFLQVGNGKFCYIYEKTHIDTNLKYYEVILRYTVKGFDWVKMQETDELIELYPKSHIFGKRAWDFSCYERALKKFDEIENRV